MIAVLPLPWVGALTGAGLPSPFAAEYQLTRNGIPFGTMEQRLTYTGDDGYRIEVRILPHKVLTLFQQWGRGTRKGQTEDG